MPSPKQITVGDFTNKPEVVACIDRLNAKFPAGTDKELLVSDVLDDKRNQYVHLVQKGGGVLGVALVGYTYVLEKMGIRFLRQAGTSAGAINTALMTVIGDKQDAKSEKILDAICKLDFFSLVDGHPVARWLIKKFIQNNTFVARVKKFLIILFASLLLFLTADIILAGMKHTYPELIIWSNISLILTGVTVAFILFIVFYSKYLLKKLKDSGFGVNPGRFFYNWIKDRLTDNGVKTVSDLTKKASAPVPGLCLRVENDQKLNGLNGDVTFITSELVTQNKIQLPAMCNLFRKAADIDTLEPAGFVRASMSIPVFFESYMIDNIPCKEDEIKKAWSEFGVKDAPSTARFVDGGILSNFPISIFYNPLVSAPRLPVFGIDLDDSTAEDTTNTATAWSFGGYIGRMFNTIRNYYDKDFLIKNKMYENGIGKIPVAEYNWLNFFMKDEQKVELFIRGALAAEKFLNNFNWYEYKGTRIMEEEKLN